MSGVMGNDYDIEGLKGCEFMKEKNGTGRKRLGLWRDVFLDFHLDHFSWFCHEAILASVSVCFFSTTYSISISFPWLRYDLSSATEVGVVLAFRICEHCLDFHGKKGTSGRQDRQE